MKAISNIYAVRRGPADRTFHEEEKEMKMKKLLTAAMAAAMVFSLTACGSEAPAESTAAVESTAVAETEAESTAAAETEAGTEAAAAFDLAGKKIGVQL